MRCTTSVSRNLLSSGVSSSESSISFSLAGPPRFGPRHVGSAFGAFLSPSYSLRWPQRRRLYHWQSCAPSFTRAAAFAFVDGFATSNSEPSSRFRLYFSAHSSHGCARGAKGHHRATTRRYPLLPLRRLSRARSRERSGERAMTHALLNLVAPGAAHVVDHMTRGVAAALLAFAARSLRSAPPMPIALSSF